MQGGQIRLKHTGLPTLMVSTRPRGHPKVDSQVRDWTGMRIQTVQLPSPPTRKSLVEKTVPRVSLLLSPRPWELWPEIRKAVSNKAIPPLRPESPRMFFLASRKVFAWNPWNQKEREIEGESFLRWTGLTPRLHEKCLLPLMWQWGSPNVMVWFLPVPNSYLRINWGLEEAHAFL